MPTHLSKADVQELSAGVFLHFNKPGELSPIFESALQPVDFYAPLGSYYQLCAALKKMAERGFEETEGQPAADELYLRLREHFASEECLRRHSSNVWASALIILTMEAFSEFVGRGYSREIRNAYLSSADADISEAILDDLDRLYDVARRSAPGGAAFYFVSNIVLLLPEPVDLLRSDERRYPLLAEYFDFVRSLGHLDAVGDDPAALQELLAELGAPSDTLPDHCRSYLRQRLLDRMTAHAGEVTRIVSRGFEYPEARKRRLGSWWGAKKDGTNGRETARGEEEKTVTAVMIGPPGSGKTTLVRQLVRANRKAIELGLGLNIFFSPEGEENIKTYGPAPPPGTQQMILLTGSLSLAPERRDAGAAPSKNTPFTIYDSRGGAMYASPPFDDPVAAPAPEADAVPGELSEGEKLYHVAAMANLLVLAVPPEGLGYFNDRVGPGLGTLDVHFSNFVGWVLKKNPNAMIAIAYTKCDEYGVRLGRARRIIEEETARTYLERFEQAQTPSESDWGAFVAAASRRGEGGETRLVGELLSKTTLLWKRTVRNHRHRFLNGYLVSAEPAVDYLADGRNEGRRSMESLGLLQIFADFFEHLKATEAV